MTSTERPDWRELIAVALGGVIGTGARLGIDAAVASERFPWHTLAINVVGSFVLAALASTLWARPATPSWLKAGLGVGLLGSFTTFSAVMASSVELAAAAEWMPVAGYLVASVFLSLGAAALGLRAGRPEARIGAVE